LLPIASKSPLPLLLAIALISSLLAPGMAGATIASLGDSYSSGEGAGPFERATDVHIGNGCHRSSKAWPRLLGVPVENHFACSGATTADFYSGQKRGILAAPDDTGQLDRLRALAGRESISKVYVTIGGNDLGFGRIIRDCVVYDCLRHMDSHELPKLRDKVVPAVTKALADAKSAAAGGQVILVGYPNLVPGPGSTFANCGWLTDKEKPRVWKLEDALDSALAGAARDAAVSYVSVRDALKGHELCTKDSWFFPVAGTAAARSLKLVNQQQGHPNARGQQAIAETVGRAESTGAGVVPSTSAGCTPTDKIAAIVDDSGSMAGSDPLNIRAAAMQLLITKPGGQGRTLGAVEFGEEAGPLFDPGLISSDQSSMLSSLGALQNDGFDDGGEWTNYNAAFEVGGFSQPDAGARIFLTDGAHNLGSYENGHSGGPRTYVIGLNIGPAGEGDADADQLGRIAGETGGFYFPLLRSPGDSAEVQSKRIQPVFNAIDSLIQCHDAPQQAVRTLTQASKPSQPLTSRFGGVAGLEVVLTWTAPGAQVGLGSAAVRNAGGKVIANLTGKKPRRRHGRKRRKSAPPAVLQPGIVQGTTFQTITVPRPPHGATLTITLLAPALAGPTAVNVQVSPLQSLPAAPAPAAGAPTAGSAPGGAAQPVETVPPPPPPPANHLEQETPNHPVNTFTNYHNASGMGPQIAAGQWVEVSCRVYDPTIASVNPDGYWYRIASSPWNNAYYAPANTFMNGDPYGGPYTHNTDFSVPLC
jgi:lysophospholipase L1-like esterase